MASKKKKKNINWAWSVFNALEVIVKIDCPVKKMNGIFTARTWLLHSIAVKKKKRYQ